MITITLTEEDIMRLQVIEIDRDAEDALAFIKERIIPEVKSQQGKKMNSHLDGGKGSMF
jgi:hypothetical protein